MNHDQLTHLECVDFIRLTISQSNQNVASVLATEIKELCESGQANRQQIWAELSPSERKQFTQLVSNSKITEEVSC
jgi:hypothetical protein